MFGHTGTRQLVIDETKKALDQINDDLNAKLEQEIQRCLDDWKRRYPRHSFVAWQGHGMLSVDVVYANGTSENIEFISEWQKRLAYKTLIEEVEALIDWFNDLDFRIQACCLDLKSKP